MPNNYLLFVFQGNNKMRFVLSGILCMLLFVLPSLSLAGWTIETVGDSVQQETSLDIDSSGKAHISYILGELRYATNSSGSWTWETLDSNGFNFTSLATDSMDNVHISYFDATNFDITYTTNVSGSWSTRIIDTEGYDTSSIAVDESDKLHIGYSSTQGTKYATDLSGSWVTEVVDSCGTRHKIALDSSGKVHMIYTCSGDLKYATNTSGAWAVNTILDLYQGVSYISLALDSLNNAHVSYLKTYGNDLGYGTNASGSWEFQTLDSDGYVGQHTSIGIDIADNVHISYKGVGLKYATNISGSWVTETVDNSSYVGSWTSLTIEPPAIVHISYDGYSSIKYAKNEDYAVSCTDNDGDSYGSGVPGSDICIIQWSGSDCDDVDPAINPGEAEIPYDGIDQDCSGADLTDVDGDGYSSTVVGGTDCDDSDPLEYPGQTWYEDMDGDGYSSGNSLVQCDRPAGYKAAVELTDISGDCDDSDLSVNPGETDIPYDGIDQDCSGADLTDVDGDGYDAVAAGGDDCNDNDSLINPGVSEIPGNCVDDDCNAATPDGPLTPHPGWLLECVDPETDAGGDVSAATDSSGNVHVSYYDAVNRDLIYATNSSGSWTTETVESTGSVGRYNAIALDSADKIHISYRDNNSSSLKYATNVSGSWVTETIDSAGNSGMYTSLDIDSSGSVHISYCDDCYFDIDYYMAGGTLKYATNASGSWITESLDSCCAGWYTSLAIDSNDKVHISYSSISMSMWYGTFYFNGVRHATNATGSWSFETVDVSYGAGFHTSISLDSSDNVHIGYSHFSCYWYFCSFSDSAPGDISYATNAAGSWVAENVGFGAAPSLKLDHMDRAIMSYYDAGLKYALKGGASWLVETINIGDSIGYASMAVGPQGSLHIGYSDTADNDLKYVKQEMVACTDSDSDGYGSSAAGPSLCIYGRKDADCDDSNPAINPLAADVPYDGIDQDCSGADLTDVDGDGYDATAAGGDDCNDNDSAVNPGMTEIPGNCKNDDCSFTTHDSTVQGGWLLECVDADANVGLYTSTAVDAAGNTHISYYDNTNLDLKYATNASGSWVAQTLDSAGNVGQYSSIALDSSANVYISYYDASNGDLKFMTNASGSWAAQTVDSAGNVGRHSSIALDFADNVYISYFDMTDYDLKFATNSSGSWLNGTMDSTGYVGTYTSIAIDSADNIHISYYDASNDDLKYMTNAAGSWVTMIVDSAGNVGLYSSIALDSSDNAYISYYDYTNADLKYATNMSGAWVSGTMDSGGSVGWYTSIALDSADYVHISYTDNTNNDLKYLTNESAVWNAETVAAGGVDTSIALDPSDLVHISYYDASNNSLKYATTALYTACTDSDGDGYGSSSAGVSECIVSRADTDCDDTDAAVNPGVPEVPYDGIDQDCSGADLTDVDGDGYDSTAIGGTDCDDENSMIHPLTYWYADADTDGYGDGALSLQQCLQPAGYILDGTDCDDSDAGVNPGTGEVPYNGIDDDCDAGTPDDDLDGDGYPVATDCDDTDPAVNPGAAEIACNGRDDDCNAETPDGYGPYGWEIECVDVEGYAGKYASLAHDSSDNLHISYFDETDADLKYATNAGGTWTTYTIESSGNAGRYSAIAVDSNDKVHISYYNTGSNVLKYATNAGGAWAYASVDSGWDGGHRTSIAVDSANKAHIAYHHYNSSMLKYATNASGSWVKVSLYADGLLPSIAIDSSDKVHIGYFDDINDDLMYATDAAGSWSTGMVADFSPTGWGVSVNISMALDSSDSAHISYYDSGYLKYAANAAGTWSVEGIGDGPGRGLYSSIEMDSLDHAHISYYDDSGRDLKYATNVTGSWTTQIVESAGDVGHFTSIAIDSEDMAHIAYYDVTNAYLKHASKSIPVSCTDSDGDGYGSSAAGPDTCFPSRENTDCDDADPDINPGKTEVPYDGIDQDCSGADLTDVDEDGFDSTAAGGTDCDDSDAVLNPETLWYADNDGDGYGNPSISMQQCAQPDGFILDNTDCGDTDPDIYPGGPAVRLSPAPFDYFTDIQGAYTAAGGGDAIQGKAGELTENLVMNINKAVTIQPGYDCAFTLNSGITVINGDMEVTDGTVSVEGGVLELR